MSGDDVCFLETYADAAAFPLAMPESPAYQALLADVRADLAKDGCSVLRGFIRPEWHSEIEAQGMAVAPHAHYDQETVNAYNIPLDADLPPDHPAKITMARENAFVPRDRIPETHLIHQLYNNQLFQAFLAACFGYDRLYQLADPLAGLCMNVLRPGCAHPWHYDINEFTVSMLTKKPAAGGTFRYSPGIRRPGDENFDLVRDVLTNGEAAHERVVDLSLEVGDLQLFQGRYSLHQVSPVEGPAERHSAIFAFTLEPGVIGGTARTRQLFGRVLPAHIEAEQARVRADELLD